MKTVLLTFGWVFFLSRLVSLMTLLILSAKFCAWFRLYYFALQQFHSVASWSIAAVCRSECKLSSNCSSIFGGDFSWVHTCMKYNDLVYSVITKTLRVCIWSGSHVHSNLTVLRRK